uniref:Actin-binding Rho-activating protein n=1 Tax=Xiphophorus couchianus TaxID=32473 RepID=A0A3B5LXD6_9TELE
MSGETSERKPSTNKSLRKLHAVSMVCSLTSGWQQWVADEKKQAGEPSGWAPSSHDEPEEPKKKWAPKKPHSTQTQPALETLSETRTSPSQEAPSNDGVQTSNDQPSCIKTKQVVKTVSNAALPPPSRFDQIINHCFICSYFSAFLCFCLSIMKYNMPPRYKKEAEDANKINALSKKHSAVGNLKSRWQNWAVEHTVSQKLNPFSEYFDYDYSMSLRLQKGEEGYGRPKEGTKTAERAKRAEQHIHREIDDMCYVIRTMADPDPDGKTRVTFGQLFDRYVRISDKVVGILMRARKHGKVVFEGEMLWQGQDDGVIITLMV